MDIVFPKDNEKEFIRIAEKLNIDGICFAYDKPKSVAEFQAKTKVRLSTAVLCRPDDVRRYKGRHLTIVRSPDDQSRLRHIIEKVRPDILFGLEFGRQKDFIHHRASGLNHVLATIAAQKNVAIGFSFSDVLKAKPKQRAVYMGRLMQNIRFARKFKFQTIIASFADNPWHLRSAHDTTSFFISLGITAGEAKAALEWKKR